MGRKTAAPPRVADASEPTGDAQEAQEAQETSRSLEKLFVHADTLDCALKRRCIPCGYKLVLHSRPGLLPNQRPEMCPRMRTEGAKPAESKATLLNGAKAAKEPKAEPVPEKAPPSGTIGLYDERHVKRILTVGDGNFSFSLALARAFAESNDGVTLVVTSHESRASVVETYPDGEAILQELAAMKHVAVHHEVDATNSKQMAALGKFDRVLWNFPCVRVPRGKDGQNEEMELNKKLLNDFFEHVANMLTETGEVHVTHKTKPPFSQWGMEDIAARNGLFHAQSVVFDRCLYPGYSNKKVLSKGSFPIWDSQTFVFVPASRDNKTPQNVDALQPMTPELLAKAYLILTPTLQEKLEQEARLQKMQQKREEAAAKKELGIPPTKKQKEKKSVPTAGNDKKRKQQVLAHQKNKSQKNKRQRR